jgi:hypothetical protein
MYITVRLIIPAFRISREEDQGFQPSLGYIARPCLKKKAVHRVLGKCLISVK